MAFQNIKRPWGNLRLVYDMHLHPTDPSQIPLGVEGVFLEFFGRYQTTEEVRKRLKGHEGINRLIDIPRQYSRILNHVKENEIPVFLGDFPFHLEGWWARGIKGVEAVVGLWAGVEGSLIMKRKSENGLTRREFLKLAFGGLAVGYFLPIEVLPGCSLILEREISEGDLRSSIFYFKEKIHPEHPGYLGTLKLRNLIFAQKLDFLGEFLASKKGRQIELSGVFGAGHAALPRYLKMDIRERMRGITNLPSWFRKRVRTEKEYLSLIVEARFDQQKREWEIAQTYHEPNLEAINSFFWAEHEGRPVGPERNV